MDIDKSYALSGNEGDSRIAQKLYLILHDVGNMGATARNTAIYEKRTWENAYVHFAVGAEGIFQIGEPGYVAWGALNANPYAPVQIEFENTTNQADFEKGYRNYIALAREMATKYGIPLTLDAGGAGTPGIKTHRWVTDNIGGDHVDPYGYLASHGISKEQLASDLANGLGDTITTSDVSVTKTTPVAVHGASNGTTNDDGWIITNENGTFTPQAGLRVFNYPGIGDTGIKTDGVPFEYFGYVRNDGAGYLYVATHEFGLTRYVACRQLSNGQPLGTFE